MRLLRRFAPRNDIVFRPAARFVGNKRKRSFINISALDVQRWMSRAGYSIYYIRQPCGWSHPLLILTYYRVALLHLVIARSKSFARRIYDAAISFSTEAAKHIEIAASFARPKVVLSPRNDIHGCRYNLFPKLSHNTNPSSHHSCFLSIKPFSLLPPP